MPWKVKVTCLKVTGICIQNHKPGDEVIFDGPKIIGDLCPMVMSQIYPMVLVMRQGGKFAFLKEGQKALEFVCSDPVNLAYFKIEPAGLTTEPYYSEPQKLIVEKVRKKPGIPVEELLNEFSEEQKNNYRLHIARIKNYLNELAEDNQIKIQGENIYPIDYK